MLQKLVRAVLTIAGAILGFGLYTLTKFLIILAGHKELVDFSEIQDMIISTLAAIIFGLIFFRLTPAFKKQGNKMANNLESDLQKMSANDIVMGTVGLIAGLIIAFLISQIYAGIKVPYRGVILNIITYINKKRIETSLELLKVTDLSIAEIGDLIGLNNTSYFYTLFKKETGTSPKQYRNSILS